MKALTVLPFYAQMITEGLKTVECRTWVTPHRGPIVICSSADKTREYIPVVPSHALCTAEIIDIQPFEKRHLKPAFMAKMPSKPSFAWILGNIRPIIPRPVKGQLRLWDYTGEIEYIPVESPLYALPDAEYYALFRNYYAPISVPPVQP